MSHPLSELLLRSQSDERLVSLAQAGHDRAFGTIVERYRPELLTLARRLNSDGRAEDVLQQAFLSAFVSLRSGTEVNHVRGWLYQIVRNAATKVRASRDLPLDDVVIAAEPLEDVVHRRATALSAVTELARLPKRQRDAVVATALNGLSGADVAVTMGMSEGALRQLVHRARMTLRSAATAVTPWPLVRWLAGTAISPGPDVPAAAGVVSAGGVAAKVGALLATGVLATTMAVLPPRNHDPAPSVRKHLTRAGHPRPQRVALVPSASLRGTAVNTLMPTRGSQTAGLGKRQQAGRRVAGVASSSGSATRTDVEAGQSVVARVGTTRRSDGASRSERPSSTSSDSRGGPAGASSTNPGSGQDGQRDPAGVGSVTGPNENGSVSSGGSMEGAATTSQNGDPGTDGDNAFSHDGSSVSAALSSDGSSSGPGSGQGGGSGSSGSGSSGGHPISSSEGSDAQTTPDH